MIFSYRLKVVFEIKVQECLQIITVYRILKKASLSICFGNSPNVGQTEVYIFNY